MSVQFQEPLPEDAEGGEDDYEAEGAADDQDEANRQAEADMYVDENDQDQDQDEDQNDDEALRDEAQARQANQFHTLCDGVQSAMALVHSALQGYLEFKDDLMKHDLPPSVQLKLTTTSSQLYRSISDLHFPIHELIRVVQQYSQLWEGKSTALRKLYDNYARHENELKVALDRLAISETIRFRMQGEKTRTNWMKLYAKLLTSKGQSRSWKFRLFDFKQKAQHGLEQAREYFEDSDGEQQPAQAEDEQPQKFSLHAGAGRSDDGSDDADDAARDRQLDELHEKAPQTAVGMQSDLDLEQHPDEPEPEAESESEAEPEPEPEPEPEATQLTDPLDRPSETLTLTRDRTEVSNGSDEPQVELVDNEMQTDSVPGAAAAVETRHGATWTYEPEYSTKLCCRVYKPTGIPERDLYCVMNFEEFTMQSTIFGERVLHVDEPEDEPESETASASQSRSRKRSTLSLLKKQQEKRKLEEFASYVEFHMDMTNLPPEDSSSKFNFAIHFASTGLPTAFCAVEMEDLHSVDIDTYLDDPGFENCALQDAESLQQLRETLVYNADLAVRPTRFPLFSLDTTRQKGPVGELPILFYWHKIPHYPIRTSTINTQSFFEIVLELTGVDLRNMSHEEAIERQRKIDQAVSPIASLLEPPRPLDFSSKRPSIEVTPHRQPTPSPPMVQVPVQPEPEAEPTVPKAEYDRLEAAMKKRIEEMHHEHEEKMRSLLEVVRQNAVGGQLPPVPPGDSSSSNASAAKQRLMAKKRLQQQVQQQQLQKQQQQQAQQKQQKKLEKMFEFAEATSESVDISELEQPIEPKRFYKRNFMIGKPLPKWGENLPDDFMERLDLFTKASQQHREEVTRTVSAEVSTTYEKQLADLRRLDLRQRSAETKRQQQQQQTEPQGPSSSTVMAQPHTHRDDEFETLEELCLPALFMPFQNAGSPVYNPRAHQFFHPSGYQGLRVTQPPSVLDLPAIPNRVALLNLYEMARRYEHVKQIERDTKAQVKEQPAHATTAPAQPSAPDVSLTTMTAGKSG